MMNFKNLTELYLYQVADMANGCDKARTTVKELVSIDSDPEVKEFVKVAEKAMSGALDIFKEIFKNHDKTLNPTQNKALTAIGEETKELVIDSTYEHKTLQDLAIISKLRALIHIPMAGFPTFTAYAKALNYDEDVKTFTNNNEGTPDNKEALERMERLEQKLFNTL